MLDAHDVYVHDYGNRRILSIHVTVDGRTTTRASHRIADEVERAVRNVLDAEVIVHIEPSSESGCSREVERALVSILKEHPKIMSYHTLNRFDEGERGHITVHAVVASDMDVGEAHALTHEVNDALRERFPGYRVDLHIEPCEKACDDCGTEDCEGGWGEKEGQG